MSRHAELRAALVALQPQLTRFALGLCTSRDDAEDLVQSAYERAFSRLDQWQPGSRLDSWMYRIAQSIFFNGMAARKVRERYAERGQHTQPAPVAVDRVVESRVTLERVRALVSTLPAEQRAVLMLICVEGLSYRETAEVLELPVGTITSRLGRARRALREGLDGAPMDTRAAAR